MTKPMPFLKFIVVALTLSRCTPVPTISIQTLNKLIACNLSIC